MHVIIIICFFKNDYRIELNFCLHCASLLTICTGSTMVSLCILKRANPGRRSRPIMFLRYVFRRFKIENNRSAFTVDTGSIVIICTSLLMRG